MNHASAALWLLLASGAPAQTYIVAAGGGGNFSDLPAAIAAVPSGATLHVKGGSYSAFTVTGKSLAILGETSGLAVTVQAVSQPVVITGIAAADHVHISGLVIAGSDVPLVKPRTIVVSNCQGNVTLDRIWTTDQPSLTVDASSSVHLLNWWMLTPGGLPNERILVTASNVEITDCTIYGNHGSLFAPGSALRVRSGSVVVISGSTLIGGNGANGLSGENGAVVDNSVAHVLGQGPGGSTTPTVIMGGSGSGSQSGGGSGGNGIALLSGSQARVFGATLVGGQPRGLPISADGSSRYVTYPGAGPSAFLAGIVRPGQVVKASLQASPSTQAQLLLGTESFFQQPYSLALGAWTVNPLVVLGGLTVPAAGLLEVPIPVPLGWPGDTMLFGQFVTWDVTMNEIQCSNTFTAITR